MGFLLLGGFLVVVLRAHAESAIIPPFESKNEAVSPSRIDSLVSDKLREHGIEPANLCSDEVFVRRVYLDMIGTLPTVSEVRLFLEDSNKDKRSRLIDTLFKRNEFVDYWTLKWCDLLRVKAEFPINLWPNAVQAYRRWIYEAVRENRPYNQFVRELLTSNGSNFRVPPVNFYRAVQGRESTAIAEAVALTFMGTRLAAWPEDKRTNMTAFFSRVAYKKTAEWKEEIVYSNPEASGPLDVVFPDGVRMHIKPNEDPRQIFTAWLIAKDNPWFARNIVNRIWAWLNGRGIIHEPDDIRPDNPPSNPELLAYLEKELVQNDFDLRHIYRLVLNSRTYQQSPIPQSSHPDAAALFAYYPVRRLDAEVLIDALDAIAGTGQVYLSAIPEPFTYIPEERRTITLEDGSITSSFLEMFGRPSRDTGLESERNNQVSDEQRLYLLNSTEVQRKIVNSKNLRNLMANCQDEGIGLIDAVYLCLLSRYPTESELAAAQKYFQIDGLKPPQVQQDLIWALINSKEFLYRH